MATIYLWTDKGAPDLIVEEAGDVIKVYDYPNLWDFSINDQIHYRTRFGTKIFEVQSIEPANLLDYPEEMRLVTARRIK